MAIEIAVCPNLDSSLRHDGSASDIVLSLVHHHKPSDKDVPFHISRPLSWPSEIIASAGSPWRAWRLTMADGHKEGRGYHQLDEHVECWVNYRFLMMKTAEITTAPSTDAVIGAFTPAINNNKLFLK